MHTCTSWCAFSYGTPLGDNVTPRAAQSTCDCIFIARLNDCTITIANTVPLRKRALYGMSAHPPPKTTLPPPPFGLNFLLRSSIYSKMCPYVADFENAVQIGWFMRTELRTVYVRLISNVLNGRKT